jgi:cobalt-zinc-cadmium efflux system membrane fusion protein
MMSKKSQPWSRTRKRWAGGTTIVAFIAVGVAMRWFWHSPQETSSHSSVSMSASTDNNAAAVPLQLVYPQERWAAAALEIAPVRRGAVKRTVQLTGRILLNEDRVAHIYPMVEGAVESVSAHLGQHVKTNDLLAVINSPQVGKAKLELYQARLSREVAMQRHTRMKEVNENTTVLIKDLRDSVPIEEIDTKFRDMPMGENRQLLLSAYSNYYKSHIDFERLESMGDATAVPAKQYVSAQAARNADRATFQASVEQIAYNLESQMLDSTQTMRESETRVAVAETNLKILGYVPDELMEVNPATQGQTIAHYPIRAPFDGTILSKDISLLEHVRPDMQILRLADSSTVWVSADLYQEHLPLLNRLANKSIKVRNEAWPDRDFEATIFYAGEIMDDSSRTVGLRAIADNGDGLLKPGMFVTVELPDDGKAEVLQLPVDAIQEHEGKKFVFVHLGDAHFERRDIDLGIRGDGIVEIARGLQTEEQVVVHGGFILKSQMLAELMGGE